MPEQSKVAAAEDREHPYESKTKNPCPGPDTTDILEHENPTIHERRKVSLPAKACLKNKMHHGTEPGESTVQSSQDKHVRFELAVDVQPTYTSYTRKLLKYISKFLIRLSGTTDSTAEQATQSHQVN